MVMHTSKLPQRVFSPPQSTVVIWPIAGLGQCRDERQSDKISILFYLDPSPPAIVGSKDEQRESTNAHTLAFSSFTLSFFLSTHTLAFSFRIERMGQASERATFFYWRQIYTTRPKGGNGAERRKKIRMDILECAFTLFSYIPRDCGAFFTTMFLYSSFIANIGCTYSMCYFGTTVPRGAAGPTDP